MSKEEASGKREPAHEQMRNVYQRINEVRKTSSYLQKLKEVDGKYKVVTHDQVTAGVRDDLIAHGIVIEPSLKAGATVQDTLMKTTKAPIIRYESEWQIAFVNIDDPADRAVVVMPAHALDTGDKAPGKACSYATKMAILKMFNIVTGEDEEKRAEEEASADSISAKQYADFEIEINDLSAKGDIDADAQKLWEKIHVACTEKKDESSRKKLRARLTAKVSALRKAAKIGGGDAAHAKH